MSSANLLLTSGESRTADVSGDPRGEFPILECRRISFDTTIRSEEVEEVRSIGDKKKLMMMVKTKKKKKKIKVGLTFCK